MSETCLHDQHVHQNLRTRGIKYKRKSNIAISFYFAPGVMRFHIGSKMYSLALLNLTQWLLYIGTITRIFTFSFTWCYDMNIGVPRP